MTPRLVKWIGALESAPNTLHFGAGALKRDAVSQSTERKAEIAALSVVKIGEQHAGGWDQRQPEIHSV